DLCLFYVVGNPMREIFNRIKWRGERGQFVFINRGGPSGVEVCPTEAVVEVGHNGVVVEREGKRRYIPYHRIVEIRLDNGVVLLSRWRER
ncbi:MAG: RNA repair domain-containing protein, partial [Pyrobaculum sp.]